MTPGVAIEWARPKAESDRAKALLEAADELLALGQLGARMRYAQQHYYRVKGRQGSSDAQLRAALGEAQRLEAAYDQELVRLGLGRQQALPGTDEEPPGWAR